MAVKNRHLFHRVTFQLMYVRKERNIIYYILVRKLVFWANLKATGVRDTNFNVFFFLFF